VTWLVCMRDVTHSYVWFVWFKCMTWLIHRCDMTRSYVWHALFTRVSWRIHMYDMMHSYVWHIPFKCASGSKCDQSRTFVTERDSHANEPCHTIVNDWLSRSVTHICDNVINIVSRFVTYMCDSARFTCEWALSHICVTEWVTVFIT